MTIGKIALGVFIGNIAFAVVAALIMSILADNAAYYAVEATLR